MAQAKRSIPTWIRETTQQSFDKVCHTPNKKLAAKIVLGVGVGAVSVYLLCKLVRRIRESTVADLVTLKSSETPVSVKLIDKVKVTGDTRRLRFALPSPHHTVGVPAGNYLYVTATINGVEEVRPYTPVAGEHNERGEEKLVTIHSDIVV